VVGSVLSDFATTGATSKHDISLGFDGSLFSLSMTSNEVSGRNIEQNTTGENSGTYRA
jgi:hypothetical protein